MPVPARRLGLAFRAVDHDLAEVLEFVVRDDAFANGRKLRELPLGDRAWVGVLIRDGRPQAFGPETTLTPGDRVHVYCQPDDAAALGGSSPGRARWSRRTRSRGRSSGRGGPRSSSRRCAVAEPSAARGASRTAPRRRVHVHVDPDEVDERAGPIGHPAPAVIAVSRSSGETRASSRTRMQSFRSGMRTRFTTKPGVSWHRIGRFPSRSPTANAASTASSAERSARTISTSGMSGAGLKKCMPTTRSGEDTAAAISVTESADVFVARMTSGRIDALELGEERELRVEILDDRLDHEVTVGERGELDRQRQPFERGPVVTRGQLPFVDLPLQVVRDPILCLLPQFTRDLAADHLVAGLDRELRDAGPHSAEPDDADPLDVRGHHDARSQRRAWDGSSVAEPATPGDPVDPRVGPVQWREQRDDHHERRG